ncbi:TrmO family methyltransferase domain-containing protein [Nocardia gipuzkoensis]|jgi:tRNA (adenine37-N6)-methyltransferase|uniref:TrmO family methyltransferase domain-containing protein n=1 Tax=Nocardia gipuzkoensis TaxID=2749991 RepID=UPI0015EF0E2D|nr:TrmO family methyltransferase [Nocardia gipuzkoensis]
MTDEVFEVAPVAHVIGGRREATDDHWGTEAIIRIDDRRFTVKSVQGLEEFSHLEIVFRFRLTDPTDLGFGGSSARDNPTWPEVGIFAHRDMPRINWLGVSRARLLRVDGLDLHVAELDAVDGTPVLDIKPWFAQCGPRGEIRQARWSTEMLDNYS